MWGSETNPYPIQLLVNYWEIKPALLGERLNDLIRSGIHEVCTFVPWQAAESDITHGLARFLLAAHERKIRVTLILSPEVGVHTWNSGVPRDVLQKPENLAAGSDGGTLFSALPPNIFPLPSLLSPEFTKRYHRFLSRVDSLIADLDRTDRVEGYQVRDFIKFVLTGSYWKYYRSHRVSAENPFMGVTGDHSGVAEVTYRNRVDQLFAQKEFADSKQGWSYKLKARGFESRNRKWFAQHCEEVFRTRATQFLGRKTGGIPFEQIELYTPETDPSLLYSSFLQLVSGSHADFSKLSKLLDEYTFRSALVSSGMASAEAKPFVHWTGMGGFQTLSDSEKQFLLLKTILLFGGRRGGFLIDEEEWFSLSPGFRARATHLARSVSNGELRLKTKALYLTPHLWSEPDLLWKLLSKKLSSHIQCLAQSEGVRRFPESMLLAVDSQIILTKDLVLELLDWVRTGRVLVLSQNATFTDQAREILEEAICSKPEIQMELGLPYHLHVLGQGRLVLYDLPEERPFTPRDQEMFLVSLLALADIENPCAVSDARIELISLHRSEGGVGLFVLNPSGRAVSADLIFSTPVEVGDLSSGVKQDLNGASRFGLEVPPCGILPIAVESPVEKIKNASAKLNLENEKSDLLFPLDAQSYSTETRGSELWN